MSVIGALNYVGKTVVMTVVFAGIGATIALVASAPIAATAALFAAYRLTDSLLDGVTIVNVVIFSVKTALILRAALDLVAVAVMGVALIHFGILSAPIAVGFGVFCGATILACDAYSIVNFCLRQA